MDVRGRTFHSTCICNRQTLTIGPVIAPSFRFRSVLERGLVLRLGFLTKGGLLGAKGSSSRGRTLFLSLSSSRVQRVTISVTHCVGTGALTLLGRGGRILRRLGRGNCPVILISGFCNGVGRMLGSTKVSNCFRSIVRSTMIKIHGPGPTVFTLKIYTLSLPTSRILMINSACNGSVVPTRGLNYRAL